MEFKKSYVEKVLNKYTPKEKSKIEKLRELDKKATKGPSIFAYVFGTISSLVLGFGMCVAMRVILPTYMWLGIVIGIIGIIMCLINYPIYKKMFEKNRKKYAPLIQSLSQEILNENKGE